MTECTTQEENPNVVQLVRASPTNYKKVPNYNKKSMKGVTVKGGDRCMTILCMFHLIFL